MSSSEWLDWKEYFSILCEELHNHGYSHHRIAQEVWGLPKSSYAHTVQYKGCGDTDLAYERYIALWEWVWERKHKFTFDQHITTLQSRKRSAIEEYPVEGKGFFGSPKGVGDEQKPLERGGNHVLDR